MATSSRLSSEVSDECARRFPCRGSARNSKGLLETNGLHPRRYETTAARDTNSAIRENAFVADWAPDDPACRYIERRQTSRGLFDLFRRYEFSDDTGRVLGSMKRPYGSHGGTLITPIGRYECESPTVYNARVLDLSTGEVIMGEGESGARLPDGRDLTLKVSGGHRPIRAMLTLTDSDGSVLVYMYWLRQVMPNIGRYPLGRAALAPGLEPIPQLLPLLIYAFYRLEREGLIIGGS